MTIKIYVVFKTPVELEEFMTKLALEFNEDELTWDWRGLGGEKRPYVKIPDTMHSPWTIGFLYFGNDRYRDLSYNWLTEDGKPTVRGSRRVSKEKFIRIIHKIEQPKVAKEK